MVDDGQIAKAASRFVDARYALGDPKRGWDCLNSLDTFFRDLGVTIPQEFEGINRETYPDAWKKDEAGSREKMDRYLRSLGHSVDRNHIVRGDLLLFSATGVPTFPGIYLGNGNMLMVCGKREGVLVVPLRYFRTILNEARRLL